MGNSPLELTAWSLRGSLAELHSGNLSGRIDIAQPYRGLHGISLLDAPPGPANVLGVHRALERNDPAAADGGGADAWPLQVAETYIRGNDLVAGYEPCSDWPFSPQLYWRANTLRMVKGELASISLLVSVQTHLLDTCPQIVVSSHLPFGEAVLLAISDSGQRRIEPVDGSQTFSPGNESHCLVRRPQNWPHSYVEIMEASDFRELSVRSETGGISSEWQLFADFLEKGVIRRARVHGSYLPRENDIELAAVCCQATRQLELPLTT